MDPHRLRMLDEAVAAEVAERGDVVPPWLRYPEHPPFSGFWRMGGGEWFVMVWERRHGARARDAKITYFRAHGAIPPSWADWVASAIEGWRELEDEATMAEQVRRLARETGLVDADAWERSLAALGDEET